MTLCLLIAAIDLNHITQTLEGMEGQSNGQKQWQIPDRVIPMQKIRQMPHIDIEEVEIFKDEQDKAGRYDADDQINPSLMPLWPFNEYRRRIINKDRCEQYQDINGDERHVKDTAGPK